MTSPDRPPLYAVSVEAKMWRNFQNNAPAAVVRAAKELRDDFLRHSPTDTFAAHPRLKRLRGKLRHLWQYDLPAYYRMWYRVDETTMTVVIEYVGPHP